MTTLAGDFGAWPRSPELLVSGFAAPSYPSVPSACLAEGAAFLRCDTAAAQRLEPEGHPWGLPPKTYAGKGTLDPLGLGGAALNRLSKAICGLAMHGVSSACSLVELGAAAAPGWLIIDRKKKEASITLSACQTAWAAAAPLGRRSGRPRWITP